MASCLETDKKLELLGILLRIGDKDCCTDRHLDGSFVLVPRPCTCQVCGSVSAEAVVADPVSPPPCRINGKRFPYLRHTSSLHGAETQADSRSASQ
jgi:hypothetical protein